ncbi:MAG: hypothetical protein KDD94_04300 [Calditrichaeota bacterium]|nr:hypothetical protein [Calditrichota bacterium]
MRFNVLILSVFIQLTYSQNADFPCLRSDFSRFHQLQGKWSSEGKYRLNGAYIETSGSAEIVSDLGGCALLGLNQSLHNDKFYQERFLISVRDSIFYRSRVDSEHGSIGLYIGTMVNDSLIMDKGTERIRNRFKLFFEDTDRFTTIILLSTDYGKSWAMVETNRYRRND